MNPNQTQPPQTTQSLSSDQDGGLLGGRPLAHRPAFVAEALRISAGIVAHAAETLRVTPQTVRRYIREYPECKEACIEAREMNCDLAETKLLQNIKDGKEASIFFYLKTQAKSRGYIEGREITGPNGGPITYQERNIDETKLTHEQQLALLDAVVDPDDETDQG